MQKVAVYCRVSTDREDQLNSLENQKKYFTEYIARNPSWELSGIYADEGITGTSTRKRQSFHRMIRDAECRRFDLIVTKEISRFARNTLDSIFYTRKLKQLGIGVLFMSDNINTLDSDAELRLTIMSSIAQEESRRTSERVKWGQRRSMERGIVFGRDMLGYDVQGGKLYVNETGAGIVRLIFHKFTNEGKGTHVIARELKEAGIPVCGHMKEWSNVQILRVLRNEKYTGDLVQKKTYTPDYLTHEKRYNMGEEDFIILRNHHEPIISRELFERTKQELKRRSAGDEERKKHSSRYCFSGKLKCGFCGCTYCARNRIRTDGSIYRSWKCYEAVKHGRRHRDKDGGGLGCNAPVLKEEELKLLLQKMIKELPVNKKDILRNIMRFITNINLREDNACRMNILQSRAAALAEKRVRLAELYLADEISKEDYNRIYRKYAGETEEVSKEIAGQSCGRFEEAMRTDAGTGVKQRYGEIIKLVSSLLEGEIWNDTFYRNILDKIVVKGSSLEVFLKD